MKDYDVLIIGGGPAGSTLASCLLNVAPGKKQPKVAILDKNEFPNPNNPDHFSPPPRCSSKNPELACD